MAKLEVPALSQLYQVLSDSCVQNRDTYEATTCFFTALQEEANLENENEPETRSKVFLQQCQEYLLTPSAASKAFLNDFGLELVQLLVVPHVDYHKDDVSCVCNRTV